MRPKCCLPQRINNFFRKKESFMNIFVGFCFFSNEIFLDEGHLKVERMDLRGLAPVTLYIIHLNVFNALSSIREKAAYFQYCFPQGTPRPRACRRHFLQLSHFQDTENQVCFFSNLYLLTFKLCMCVCNAGTYSKYRRSNLFSLSPSHQTVGE